MINKQIICLHTKNTYKDKKSIVDKISIINNKAAVLPFHKFIYKDWRLTAGDTSLDGEWQDDINSEIIDTADIVIAIVHNTIDDKELKKEINRVLKIKKEQISNLPKFLLFFKTFNCASNDDEQYKQLIKIRKYKKYLQRKNHKIDLFDYSKESQLLSRIENFLTIWFDEESKSYAKQVEKDKEEHRRLLQMMHQNKNMIMNIVEDKGEV